MLGALIKEHNTGMTETRVARVEQNTRQKAEPSTLYQEKRELREGRGREEMEGKEEVL